MSWRSAQRFALLLWLGSCSVVAAQAPSNDSATEPSVDNPDAAQNKKSTLASEQMDKMAADLVDAVGKDSVQSGSAPWQGASDVSLPPFLQDTGRRVVDTRPGPTPSQVEALRQMQDEVDRFSSSGQAYRNILGDLLNREYTREKHGRTLWYGRQIDKEETELNQARTNAIALFERFVRRYPDNKKYTPDAMFRLGELYFERSSIRFQDLYDAAEAARVAGNDAATDSLPASPDYSDTLNLYKTLAAKFPEYERIDGVYYLIGYTLSEMGRQEEALASWQALVCNNKAPYDPDWKPSTDPKAPIAARYPALTLRGTKPGSSAFSNPYQDCKPVNDNPRFVSETWFRIGEFHFDDFGAPNALELSIAAYNNILSNKEDRNYSLALYKVAWAYYRASRYPEAIRYFGDLVQWSDDTAKATGRAGSDLRPEAIEYLGIAFAYDDWNENQVPDPVEGK
ncbi:MAG: tetratricopeptide repeat protein, partial [Polyangiales bacterium]